MHWACLLLPHLALDAVLRVLPDPDAPHVLVSGPVQRRVLQAVSPAAAALGLRRGMPVSAAQALTTAFIPHPHDPRAEAQARALLAAWAYGFSSQVSLDLPHALVLEVGRSRRLFGDWGALARRLRDELQAMGWRHRLVAAPNPHAARVLANVHDGLGIGESQLATALGQVPVERAGFAPEVARALHRMGQRRLRDVFALPRDGLARRFPPEVLAHLDAMRGHGAAPLTWYAPPDRFDATIEFEHEVESSQALLFPLRRLTADLGAFLAGRDGGVQRFTLWFAHEGCAPTALVVGLLAAERDPAVLFELARSRLDHVALPAATRGLRLEADELPPFVPAARDLFDTRPQQAVPWPQLRERLRARLGDDAVQGLGLQPDHRPEQATRASVGEVRVDAPAWLPERPAWLLARPVPMRDARLRLLHGPERIESGWWDGDDVRRDYYIAETSQGQRAWVFCAPGGQGPFMLHGWFA